MELFGAWGTAAIELLSELTEHSRSLGANDTRLVGGWSAPHWQELARQNVSIACQRGNVWLLTSAAARRRQRSQVQTDVDLWHGDDDDSPDGGDVAARSAPVEGARLVHMDRAQARRAKTPVSPAKSGYLPFYAFKSPQIL